MPRTVERPNRYFTFLRRLRADGRSNMYGAIPYLAAAFGIDRNESFRIICEWIDGQAHASADVPPRKNASRTERPEHPTLFDPAPASPASVAGRSTAEGKPRKPVKQRAPARASRPRGGATKKPRRPSDSRAA